MNSTPSRRDEREVRDVRDVRDVHEQREELVRLLPDGSLRHGLAPGRRSHHKDVLMQLIDSDSRAESPSRPRRYGRPVLIAACVAAAVAATLTVVPGGDGDHGGGGTAASSGVGRAGQGAVVTLDRIAVVASKTGVRPVKDSQFVYVRTRASEDEADWGTPAKPGPLHDREVWFSQEPGPLVKYGLIRENGDTFPIRTLVPPGSKGVSAGIDRPTYAWFASLPTNPAALLKRLYAATPVSGEEDQDQAVFDRIGELIQENLMPPATAAAIYRATARIPGVIVVDGAVDAAGRHGIAIARDNTRMGMRTEWIFDPDTLSYLGERSVLSRDSAVGKKGTIIDTRAVLERAVVDKAGQTPDREE